MDFLRLLAGIRTPFGEQFFAAFTHLGEGAIAIIIVAILYWCVDKRKAYFIGVVLFMSGCMVQGLKLVFRIDRPWVLDPSFQPVEDAVAKATGYSFPSGHTQNATALYGSLAVTQRKKWVGTLLFLVAICVGFSRMYLGVHTPKDVCTAFSVTLASILVFYFVDKKTNFIAYNGMNKAGYIVLALYLIGTIVLFAMGIYYFKAGIVSADNVADAGKMAGAGAGFIIGYFLEHKYIQFSPKADKGYKHALKLVVGIAGVVVCKEGLKVVLGSSYVADSLRYFIMILWAMAGMPYLIKKCKIFH